MAGLRGVPMGEVRLATFPSIASRHLPVSDDRQVAVLPVGHPLAAAKSVPLRALRNEPWAIDMRPDTLSDVIFAMCEKRGFRPRVIGRFDACDVISALVGEGCAVSALPEIRVANWARSGVTDRPLRPDMRRHIRMAVRKGEARHPAVQATMAIIAQVSDTLPREGARVAGVSQRGEASGPR